MNLRAARDRRRPVRAAQAGATATRILDTTINLLGTRDVDLSLGGIAAAAGVSAPTVARYFPNRDAIFTAVERRIEERFGRPAAPGTVAELRAAIPELHRFFAAHEPLVRAVVTAPRLRPFWEALRQRRDESIRHVLQGHTASLPPARATAVCAIVLRLIGVEQWLDLRDHWRLDDQTITAATLDALDAVLAGLERHLAQSPPSKEPKHADRSPALTRTPTGSRDADRPGNRRSQSARSGGPGRHSRSARRGPAHGR